MKRWCLPRLVGLKVGHGAGIFAASIAAAALFAAALLPLAPAPASADPVSPPPAAARNFSSKSDSGGVAISGQGSSDGYHVRAARASDAYGWSDVAVLRPAGLDASTWYGYQCVSSDGRYAAVAVLPGSGVNDNVSRDRGAYAYGIDLRSGAVRALASGVGLKYHSPGCGTTDTAVFSASIGSDESTTEVLQFDLTSGKTLVDTVVRGQVTSTVPTSSRLIGALNDDLVAVPAGGTAANPASATIVASAGGAAYDLRANDNHGVDFLARDAQGDGAKVQQFTSNGVRTIGNGNTAGTELFQGVGGHNSIVGASVDSGTLTERDVSALPLGASEMTLDGAAAFGARRNEGAATSGAAASTQTQAAEAATLPDVESLKTHAVYSAANAELPSASAETDGLNVTRATGSGTAANQDRREEADQPAPSEARQSAHTSSFERTGPASLSVLNTVATKSAVVASPALSAGATTPKCSIPRLEADLEAMQPSNAQVNWATQMAEQGLLTGAAYTRPANFANMGLVAYAPSSDFPPIQLSHPAGSSTTTVPRSVMLAIEAQESNFNQASWHALPGIAGDPLIASYYGVGDSIDHIDYPDADCGYGIAQVTTGMAAADTSISRHGEMKIAVDYQENIAAGLQILEKTWNALYADGITANGGDPKFLENWYFAAWAYNTGIQPNASFGNTTGCNPGPSCAGPDGTWGVGWSNNPQNPDYDPARKPYLQSTYADAAHPSSWPYQERIMGWMASPILRYGYYGYNTPTYNGGSKWLQIPPVSAFCNSSNDCNPGDAGKQYCSLADSECWWHNPVTWVASCSTTCATSAYEYAAGSTEPTYAAKYTPTCNQDGSVVPSGSIIVDDLAAPSQDDQGCSGMNWSNNGSFTYSPGTNSSGDPVGNIDTHQLGSGFGGHILFTHTEPASSTSLIDSGTWKPNLPSRQYYKVKLHLPASGATAGDVIYTINPGGGATPWKIRVNQSWGSEQWVTIGTFGMQNGGSVVLTNASNETPEKYDVAFDAVAFVPEGGDASTPLGGPPGIQDEPAGSNPAWVNCGCARRTAGDPVDTASGYFGESATDVTTPGLGIPLAVDRKYSAILADSTGPAGSAAIANGAFGYGWSWNYGMSTTVDSAGNVTVHQEDGSSVPFNNASGAYTPSAPRYDATLTKSGSSYVFTRRGSDQFVFDATTGRLNSESDLAGRAATPPYSTNLTYNASGQLATVTDPGGRTYTFTWTGAHITKVVTSGSQEVDYAYSAAGDLTDVYGVGTSRSGTTLGNQDRAQYTYSTKHLMLTERAPVNYNKTGTPTPVTTNVYDSSDRVASQTDPDGDKTTFDYGPDSSTGITAGQTLVTNPVGDETLDTYTNGLLASETKGYGTAAAATTSYQYDPMTLGVLMQTNPDGSNETFTYDDAGDMISSSDGIGRTTDYQYNAAGQTTVEVDPAGLETQWNYNAAGAVTSITKSYSGQSAESANDALDAAYSRQSSDAYADPARPAETTSSTDPDGNKSTYSYDAFGDLASSTNALGETTKYGWTTALGRKMSTVSPSGTAAGTVTSCTPPATGCTTYTYDSFGDLASTTDPLGHTTSATFDPDGNQLTSTDGNGHTTTTTYDAADRATVVTRPSGSASTTTYNADGTIAKTTDARGFATKYSYDARGELLTTTDPDGNTTTNTWNAAGELDARKDPNGVTATDSYDAAGALVQRTYSDNTPTVKYSYDTVGRRVTMNDGTGTSAYSYDVYGELVAETNGAGATTKYNYDADGNTTAIQYPGATAPTVARVFDAAGELISVTDPNGAKNEFTFTPDGMPSSENFGNGDSVTIGYDRANQIAATALSRAGASLGSESVSRDAAGDILTQAPSAGSPGVSVSYTYTADQYLSTSSGNASTTYSYDKAGNPTQTASGSGAYDSAGRLCWNSASTASNAACSSAPAGATIFKYDADGNRISDAPASGVARSWSYNGAGELITARNQGAVVGTYAYDGDGLRAAKTTDSITEYAWDTRSSNPLLLTDGKTDFITGPTGAVIEQWSAAGSTWLFQDPHGSTVAVLADSGVVAGSYTYTPAGAVDGHTGAASTPLQFAGAYVDAETGLLYLQARYYDPGTSLFMSVDPLVGSTGQPYLYADDDPINLSDPSGLWWGAICAGGDADLFALFGGAGAASGCIGWSSGSGLIFLGSGTGLAGGGAGIDAGLHLGIAGGSENSAEEMSGPACSAGGGGSFGVSISATATGRCGKAPTSGEIDLGAGAEAGGYGGVGVTGTCVWAPFSGYAGCGNWGEDTSARTATRASGAALRATRASSRRETYGYSPCG